MAPLFGDSAFVLLEENEHFSGRQVIMPAFQRAAVLEHAEMINDVATAAITSWPVGTALSLTPRLYKLTLKVMLAITIGGANAACDELETRMLDMLSVMGTFLLQEPSLRHIPGWRSAWLSFVRRRHAVDELIASVIRRRRSDGQARGDLLATLLAAHNHDGSKMSERQIRDNLVSVIIAGHETTAATLAWAFQLLAHHPTVQARLIDELDDGRTEAYMTATIEETLRHRPPFLFISPRDIVDQIEIGGWTYRPPAQLVGCTYLMHHDAELYRDPHCFCPERFLAETPRPGTWLPWGLGRKRCPGRDLALLEIKAVLKAVLSQRTVRPASPRIERPRWRSAIVTPGRGCRVVLHARTAAPRPARVCGETR